MCWRFVKSLIYLTRIFITLSWTHLQNAEFSLVNCLTLAFCKCEVQQPMSHGKSRCRLKNIVRVKQVSFTSSILTTQNHRNKNARYFITQTKVSMWARRLSHSGRTNVRKIDFAFKIGNRKSDTFDLLLAKINTWTSKSTGIH